jgi:hypothetical protein
MVSGMDLAVNGGNSLEYKALNILKRDAVLATSRDGSIHENGAYQVSSNSDLKPRKHYAALGSLFATVILALSGSAEANIISAATASLTDVTAAVTSAADGDTVMVPAGTVSWTSALTINKAITFQGAGIGKTIILDGLPDNAPSPQSVVVVNTSAGKTYRVTGLEFQGSTARTTIFGKGCLRISGLSSSVRVDNCRFYNLRNRSLYLGGATFGVVDHCNFQNGLGLQGIIYIDHSEIPGPTGQTGSYGDGSWSTPTNLGSANAMFFEDNVMNGAATGNVALTDGNGGDRIVVRYNTITNMNIQGHGTGSTGRTRSIRSAEIYQNTISFTPTGQAQAAFIRGGTGVIWGNTIIGANTNSCFTFIDYRATESLFTWKGCDGRTVWDLNDTTGGPGGNGIYLSGTAGAGSSAQTLVVTGASFTPNQWRGYSILNLDQSYSDGTTTFPNTFDTIDSNTENTIKVGTAPHPYANVIWAPGNRFEIRKVTKPLDNVGNGPGDYLGGGFSPTPRWLNQTSEPYYLWSNTNNGGSQGGIGTTPDVKAGVNFINNGATPKSGYTPYAYPHPLVSGAPVAPAAPRNLRTAP